MQQNNDPSLKSYPNQPSHPLLTFLTFLQTQQKFIETQLTPLLTHPTLGLAHTKYPVKSLKFRKPKFPKEQELGSWYDIKTKMEKRTQKLKDPNISRTNTLIVTSDLLIWSIPNLCASYMGMMNYIKKWRAEELPKQNKEQQAEKNEFVKKLICSKESEYLKFSQNEQLLELQLLKTPLAIISDYFQKWLEINQYYQDQQTFFKQKLITIIQSSSDQTHTNQQSDLLKNLVSQAKLQNLQIQTRVKQARKYIQDIDSTESLDPQVYKNRLILNQYKPQVNPKNKYLQQFGKRLHFLMILKKRVLKAEKNLKDRKSALFQLIDMQRNYIEILAGYIEGIKQPIEKLKILSEAEERLLFCNIEEIKKFHQELYQILLKRYEKHQKYTTYGDIIKGVIPFFKLYIDYIYQAQNAHTFISKLIKENEKIKEICDKYFLQKHKPASDELLQPTYKIARYEMLFDEIIKKSNPSTADHKLFTEAKQLFNSKLTQVNNTVDKIVRRNKLNQLQLQFGSEEQPILNLKEDDSKEHQQSKQESRIKQPIEYLNEFNVQLIYQERQLNIILFVFTHLVLIVEENTRKKIYYIKADKKFYVRRQEDSKVYRNIIKIHSNNGYVTITTGKDEKNLKKVQQLYQTLKKVQKTTESKQLVYVQVLGTQEIGSTSFAKYTQYIVEIKFLALKKLLHFRFSEIANIVKVMQHQYKDSLGITQDETLKKTWFNNHKSKTIENRKRVIQQILQKLFNHNLIKQDPRKLLNYLNLPQNFFEIAKNLVFQNSKWTNQSKLKTAQSKDISPITSSKLIKQSTLQQSTKQQKSVTMSKLTDSSALKGLKIGSNLSNSLLRSQTYLSKKQLKEAFTLLCATEIKLGRDIYHDVDQKVQIQKGDVEKVEIYIHTMPHNQVKMVRVTKYDTVEDVCNKVSKLLGLRENRDFRLFHQIGKKQLRVLQHEQLILKIFTFPKSKRHSQNGNVSSLVENVANTFQSMASSLIKVLSPQTHPTLIFKKYYFLPFEIESRQCRKDLTRLRLLAYQVFAEVKQMKYQLNFEEYLDMAALLIYIQFQGNIDIQAIEPQVISRIIPDTIFKLKNYSEQEWLKKVEPKLMKYVEQLKKIILENEQQMKNKIIKNDSPQKTALYFGHRHLASQIVLNKIKSNPIFGSNLFYVQPYKKIYEQLKNTGLKMSYNMWLAVKVDSISLLTPSSKQPQFELKYSDIDKINVYSEAIVFKTDDYTNKQYRFNTYQSFQISQLVKYYKTLNEIMRQLKEDQKLSNEVKKYRNQIQKYRSTYENHQQTLNTHMDIINFAKNP